MHSPHLTLLEVRAKAGHELGRPQAAWLCGQLTFEAENAGTLVLGVIKAERQN